MRTRNAEILRLGLLSRPATHLAWAVDFLRSNDFPTGIFVLQASPCQGKTRALCRLLTLFCELRGRPTGSAGFTSEEMVRWICRGIYHDNLPAAQDRMARRASLVVIDDVDLYLNRDASFGAIADHCAILVANGACVVLTTTAPLKDLWPNPVHPITQRRIQPLYFGPAESWRPKMRPCGDQWSLATPELPE